MFIAHLRFCPPVFISEMAKIQLARFETSEISWQELRSVLRTTMRQAGLFGEEAARCLEPTRVGHHPQGARGRIDCVKVFIGWRQNPPG